MGKIRQRRLEAKAKWQRMLRRQKHPYVPSTQIAKAHRMYMELFPLGQMDISTFVDTGNNDNKGGISIEEIDVAIRQVKQGVIEAALFSGQDSGVSSAKIVEGSIALLSDPPTWQSDPTQVEEILESFGFPPPGSRALPVTAIRRGSTKLIPGARWTIEKAAIYPECHIALMGGNRYGTQEMIESILACSPPGFIPVNQRSSGMLVWPNGSRATVHSATGDIQRLRGMQCSFAWGHKQPGWNDKAWEEINFRLRIEPAPGIKPESLITTDDEACLATPLDKDDKALEAHQTTTQDIDPESTKPPRQNEEASLGTISTIHGEDGTGGGALTTSVPGPVEESAAPQGSNATATGGPDLSSYKAPDNHKLGLEIKQWRWDATPVSAIPDIPIGVDTSLPDHVIRCGDAVLYNVKKDEEGQ